jgi:hypothetical protein
MDLLHLPSQMKGGERQASPEFQSLLKGEGHPEHSLRHRYVSRGRARIVSRSGGGDLTRAWSQNRHRSTLSIA